MTRLIRIKRAAQAALLPILMPALLWAQDSAALLIADEINLTQNAIQLEARGNVEVFSQGVKLTAQAITYDRSADRVTLKGPLFLDSGDGQILVAEQAALSTDLQTGILTGARVVFDQKLQIAASALRKSGAGRFTEMYQTIASACRVCADGAPPLWQIRAKRIVHDAQTKQIYLDHAQLRVAGLPIFYLPRLRLPDPTVTRASGFLVPNAVSSSNLGTGLRTPYFFALGPHRDLTLTPYATLQQTYSLEARYRQAYANGSLELNGAISRDDISAGRTRSYIFGSGERWRGEGKRLSFNLALASDDSYLRTYEYSDKDRLQSDLTYTHVARDRFVRNELVAFQSLRDDDNNAYLPSLMLQRESDHRFEPRFLGGEAKLSLAAHAHFRRNDDPSLTHSSAQHTARDVLRLSADLEWQRQWIWNNGLVTQAQAALLMDGYHVNQNGPPIDGGSLGRITPYASLTARLPMIKRNAGFTQTIEPIAQLVFARSKGDVMPNEDATSVELDEANLFDFSRFTGRDSQELGDRLNLGLRYELRSKAGWRAGLMLGRSLRRDDLNQFQSGSGLDGDSSDWLLSAHYKHAANWRIDTRSVFADDLKFTKSETLIEWATERYSVTSGYTWLAADTGAGRPVDTSEWSLDGQFDFGNNWTGRLDWTYDFLSDDAAQAGLGLSYHSDCVRVDFDVKRRFTSTATLKPDTTFGVTVALSGFGSNKRQSTQGYKEKTCAL